MVPSLPNRSFRQLTTLTLMLAGAITVLPACTDQAHQHEKDAAETLKQAGDAYARAIDSSDPGERAAALRTVAETASSVSSGAPKQREAGLLLAAGARLEAARSEVARATAAFAAAQRDTFRAEQLAQVAGSLRAVAEVLDAVQYDTAPIDAGQESADARLEVSRATEAGLEREQQAAAAAAERARASAAEAFLAAQSLLTEARSQVSDDALESIALARQVKGEGIEERLKAAAADMEESLIAMALARAAIDRIAQEQCLDRISTISQEFDDVSEMTRSAATACREQADRLSASAAESQAAARRLVQDTVDGALTAALEDLAAGQSVAGGFGSMRSRANDLNAQTHLESARIHLLRMQSGLQSSAADALEALSAAKEAAQQSDNQFLSDSISRLESGLRGGSFDTEPPPPGADDEGMDGFPGSADAGSGGTATGLRLTGGLKSPDAILAVLDGRSSDLDSWANAIGTQDEALAPAIGALRSMIRWQQPLFDAAAAQWGVGASILLESGVSADQPPTLLHDGGETASIDLIDSAGTPQSIQLFSQGGRWFIAIESTVGNPAALQQIAQMAPMLTMMEPVFRAAASEVAQQIQSGTFTTPTEVQPALQQAVMAKMAQLQQGGAPGFPGN